MSSHGNGRDVTKTDMTMSQPLGDDGRHRWIGFTTGPNAPIDIKAIESIWRRWERKMNVGSDLRHSGTIFYRSDVDGCVVLRLSPFWVKSSIIEALSRCC